MLNKLRLKFIGISLTLFGLLLAVFFTLSFHNATVKIERTTNEILSQLSNNFGKQTSVYHTKSNYIVPPNFTLFLDEDGVIISNLIVSNPISYIGNNLSLLQEFVNVILESQVDSGILNVQNTSGLRYLKTTSNGSTRITFLSRIIEESEIENARLVSTNNTIYLMFLLLLTSMLLSIWTFKPIKTALDEQQQFLADASHELRTPLTAIQANLDVILSNQNKTVAEQYKWIKYIKDEVERMRTLTNDLLFLAKNNKHELKKHYKPLNISKLLHQSVLTLESLAFESNKQLHDKIQNNIIVSGDENSLKQLIIILIDNAIKHGTSNSSVNITLSKSNNRAVLIFSNTVSDTINTSKIFNRFYREDSSRNRQRGGNGLGLSIAKTIVEDHNGKINARYHSNQLYITISFPILRKKVNA